MQFRKAQRQQAKLRIGISAPSGFGKTKSALLMAFGLCEDWTKIAVIDTENNSADLYSHLGPYNVVGIDEPFEPETFIRAIELCEAQGMEVIIVDCISAEWSGAGGCLEIKDALGGAYQDWKFVTPRHNALMSKIRRSTAHMITTTRRKSDYVVQLNEKGKHAPKKLGLKEDQRDNYEYELDVNFVIEDELHRCTASKDRTELYDNRAPFVITSETGRELRKWSETGVPVLQIALEEVRTSTALVPLLAKYPQLAEDTEFRAAMKRRQAELAQIKATEAAEEARQAVAAIEECGDLYTPIEEQAVAEVPAVPAPTPSAEAAPVEQAAPAPVVEGPSAAQDDKAEEPEAEKPAPKKREKMSEEQKEKLITLLNHPEVKPSEKKGIHLNFPTLTFKQAQAYIDKWEVEIPKRVEKAASKAQSPTPEQIEQAKVEQEQAALALLTYLTDNDSVLPTEMYRKLTNLCNTNTDSVVPTRKLKDALIEAQAAIAAQRPKVPAESGQPAPASTSQAQPDGAGPSNTPHLSDALAELAASPKVKPVWEKYPELQENAAWKEACANRRKELTTEREEAANALLQFVQENEEALGVHEAGRLRGLCHDMGVPTSELVLNREQGMEWLLEELAYTEQPEQAA